MKLTLVERGRADRGNTAKCALGRDEASEARFRDGTSDSPRAGNARVASRRSTRRRLSRISFASRPYRVDGPLGRHLARPSPTLALLT